MQFFTVRAVRHWHRLAREVVDAPFLEVVQGQGGWSFEQPNLMEGDPAHGKGVKLDFQPKPFCDDSVILRQSGQHCCGPCPLQEQPAVLHRGWDTHSESSLCSVQAQAPFCWVSQGSCRVQISIQRHQQHLGTRVLSPP